MVDSKPIWRVNRHPRFSVLEIGEYMAADDGPRETLARNMKYERLARSLTYRKLYMAVTNYLISPTRDKRILFKCMEDLEEEKETVTDPQKIDSINYEIRALEAFERSLNALALGGLNLTRAPQSGPLMIEGVRINVRPTALIRAVRPRSADMLGAMVIDAAKGILPKTDEAKARLTKAMEHSAILVHQHVEETADGDSGKPSLEHCMVFHTHRQELVHAPTAYRRTLRNIQAVCRNVAGSWDSITCTERVID